MQIGITRTPVFTSYNYPIYLENSNEKNLPFYKKFGFMVLQRVQPAADGPFYWTCLRPVPNPLLPVGVEIHLTVCY